MSSPINVFLIRTAAGLTYYLKVICGLFEQEKNGVK